MISPTDETATETTVRVARRDLIELAAAAAAAVRAVTGAPTTITVAG